MRIKVRTLRKLVREAITGRPEDPYKYLGMRPNGSMQLGADNNSSDKLGDLDNELNSQNVDIDLDDVNVVAKLFSVENNNKDKKMALTRRRTKV